MAPTSKHYHQVTTIWHGKTLINITDGNKKKKTLVKDSYIPYLSNVYKKKYDVHLYKNTQKMLFNSCRTFADNLYYDSSTQAKKTKSDVIRKQHVLAVLNGN